MQRTWTGDDEGPRGAAGPPLRSLYGYNFSQIRSRLDFILSDFFLSRSLSFNDLPTFGVVRGSV